LRLAAPRAALAGPIGPLAYFFPNLTALDLSGNALTGAVPADLPLGRLVHLDLSRNALRGAWVCAALCVGGERGVVVACKNIVFGSSCPVFTFFFATFKTTTKKPGTLPSGLLGAFVKVNPLNETAWAALNLAQNQLVGPLPAAWGAPDAPRLRALWLGGNLLSGGIPDAWAPLLLGAREADVSGNRLQGPLPANFSAPPPALVDGCVLCMRRAWCF
jgi:hypothetical protein